MSARSGSRRVIVDLWSLYPVKGYDRLTEEMLCPPSTFSALMVTMKERFQHNQTSTEHRHMLNALAKHQWVGQEVVTDTSATPYLHMFHVCVCFTAHLKDCTVPACVTLSHADVCLRAPYMSAWAPLRARVIQLSNTFKSLISPGKWQGSSHRWGMKTTFASNWSHPRH